MLRPLTTAAGLPPTDSVSFIGANASSTVAGPADAFHAPPLTPARSHLMALVSRSGIKTSGTW
jgi:hypothetical protein